MSPRVLAALLALLLLVPAATPVVGATLGGDGSVAQTTPTTSVTENTTFYLQIRANGDARWTITDTYALEDENDTRAFEDLATAYVEGERDVGWEQSFRRASTAASEATGRQMNVTDVRRDYVVSEGKGTIVLEFTWTNFATVEGDRLVVGDAFNTTDGTWLGRLTEEQRLVISPPTNYGVRSVPTAVEGGELRFEGPRTFEPGYLQIVYAGEAPTTTTAPETPDDGPPFGGGSLWLGGAAVLILGLVVAVGYMARQGAVPQPAGTDDADGDDGAGQSDDVVADATDSTDDADVDVELLSDEERVERLLEQSGGRMKQARIVKETGWSNAKVSQLLSSMDEDGRIDKLRIGRENLISFPDEEIGDFEE
ncbi:MULTISPECIES: helix-turn-helix transcriptional regulator [Haloarcula]|uniref:helix-turn-helix transcriptional regulator n=1 Tax=Haloarcula TaxID=2237 RepID=UPI0023EB53D8|nr:hypothetical protein [Halomicroarcula sp. XH51]